MSPLRIFRLYLEKSSPSIRRRLSRSGNSCIFLKLSGGGEKYCIIQSKIVTDYFGNGDFLRDYAKFSSFFQIFILIVFLSNLSRYFSFFSKIRVKIRLDRWIGRGTRYAR